MARSRLERRGLPGPRLAAFMAGAAVMRAAAFRAVGGSAAHLFLGAEEMLMSLDLAARGWEIVYASDVVTHHRPSPSRDPRGRAICEARNRIWIACMRMPAADVWRTAAQALSASKSHGLLAPTVWSTLRGLPIALARRRVVRAEVQQMWREVFLRGDDAVFE